MEECKKCGEVVCVCGTKGRSILLCLTRDILQEWAVSHVKKVCRIRGLKLVKGSVEVYLTPHNEHITKILYRTK